MEFEILDEPQGEPEHDEARRDGGLREDSVWHASRATRQPGEPMAREPRPSARRC